MYARVLTASLYGLECTKVYAEADIEKGIPSFNIVGLVNQSIKEAKDRVWAAINNCGYAVKDKKITVNLTPAGLKKEGSHYDLPIALALLASYGLINCEDMAESVAVFGELTLDGKIGPSAGVLPMIIGLRQTGVRKFILPRENVREAGLIPDIEIYPVASLDDAVGHINGSAPIDVSTCPAWEKENPAEDIPDFSEIRGQEVVKRAAQLAAAGFHGMLMIGPPGVGKSMVGKRIPGILPPLTYEQQLECTQIYSIAGLLNSARPLITSRPFRSPHHNMSAAAMSGGGANPRPGEVSLAHNGVLFLDELPEFPASVLETLRQPMEDGKISIVRAAGRCSYPSKFMLVAAMNPCRCGYYGDPIKPCRCTESDRQRYMNKISGPLLDRIDIHVLVQRPAYSDITENKGPDKISTEILRKGVLSAREIQKERYKDENINFNSELGPAQLEKYCHFNSACNKLLQQAFTSLNLSARSYHRIVKLSRTIADVDGCKDIQEEHILEALNYRLSDSYFRA